jgi:hypothetical protein
MNLMGKIFTLLIFFMSICFLVISVMVGASHRNWKKAAADMNAKATQAQNIANEAKVSTTEKEKLLAAERVGRAAQLGRLESQKKSAEAALRSKEEQLRKESEIAQARLFELEQAQARIKAQDAVVAALQSTNKKYVDDIATQYSNVKNLQNVTYELNNRITSLTEKEGDMRAKLAKTQRVLNNVGMTEDSLTDHIVPQLDGLVVKVNADGLFAISLGTDDGIRVGHQLDVYRRGRFVGKGTVIKTEPDLSAVRMNPDFKVDNVREGDHVTSKF